VERIVVGLPIHMDGRVGPEADAARAFAHTLQEATQLPVDTLDERWTTVEAERALRETGHRGPRRRQLVDSVAATLLLQTYLARRQAEAAQEPA
jgi:putative Holliday junction resolvase